MSAYQRELAELENLRGLRIDDMEQENWSALIAIPAPRLRILPAAQPHVPVWKHPVSWFAIGAIVGFFFEWCVR